MGINPRFTLSSPGIPSYDYLDYVAGAGYRTFYLMADKDSVGFSYFLSTENLAMTAGGGTMGGNIDLDFDKTFNNPAILMNSDVFFKTSQTAGGSGSSFVINIYHVNVSGTETLLGTNTSKTVSVGIEATLIKIAITRQGFSVGEKLRVNIVHSGEAGSMLLNDGGGEAFISVPFVIDLS